MHISFNDGIIDFPEFGPCVQVARVPVQWDPEMSVRPPRSITAGLLMKHAAATALTTWSPGNPTELDLMADWPTPNVWGHTLYEVPEDNCAIITAT